MTIKRKITLGFAIVITGGDAEEVKTRCGGWEPPAILEKPLRNSAIRELVEAFFPEGDQR